MRNRPQYIIGRVATPASTPNSIRCRFTPRPGYRITECGWSTANVAFAVVINAIAEDYAGE